MPLHKGKSKKVQEKNFHELKEAHPEMPNKQRVAIVLSEARKSGAKIAKKPAAKKKDGMSHVSEKRIKAHAARKK